MNPLVNTSDLPIGIFDSGVGGLSIAKALHQLLPSEHILYVADSAHAPYGDKSDAYVQTRCEMIVDFLIAQKVKLIVVACNTATLSCITHLRGRYDIAFVGAEPGIKPAVAASKNGVIGVMATHSTLESKRYNLLLERYRNDKSVIQQACNGLVEQIETGALDSDHTQQLLQKYLAPMRAQNADQIVLGCTHYGFLSTQIEKILGNSASLVNTSAAIAKQASQVLTANKQLRHSKAMGDMQVFTNTTNQNFSNIFSLLWGEQPSSIQSLTV